MPPYLLLLFVIGGIAYAVWRLNRAATTHSAVLNAFLAKHTYGLLRPEQQETVKQRAAAILVRGGSSGDLSRLSELHRYCFFALAMAELGVPPGLPRETWLYVRNPFAALLGPERQIAVVKHHLGQAHGIGVDLDWREPASGRAIPSSEPQSTATAPPHPTATAMDLTELGLGASDLQDLSTWFGQMALASERAGDKAAEREFFASVASLALHALKLEWGYEQGKPKYILEHSTLTQLGDLTLVSLIHQLLTQQEEYRSVARAAAARFMEKVTLLVMRELEARSRTGQ